MFRLLKTKLALGVLPLVLLAAAAHAQYSNTQNRDDFHNGVHDGQSGGQYSQNSGHSYDQNGYDQRGYDRDGYNQAGYNPSGYNRNGQRQQPSTRDNTYNQNDRDRDNRYGDQTYPTQTNQGGIGPGKGALIGGAGGAVLGALFGGGLKGSLIAGAAGAGIGAVVGKEHQTAVRRRNGY